MRRKEEELKRWNLRRKDCQFNKSLPKHLYIHSSASYEHQDFHPIYHKDQLDDEMESSIEQPRISEEESTSRYKAVPSFDSSSSLTKESGYGTTSTSIEKVYLFFILFNSFPFRYRISPSLNIRKIYLIVKKRLKKEKDNEKR